MQVNIQAKSFNTHREKTSVLGAGEMDQQLKEHLLWWVPSTHFINAAHKPNPTSRGSGTFGTCTHTNIPTFRHIHVYIIKIKLFISKRLVFKLGMAVFTCNLRIWEAKAERSGVLSQTS